MMDTACYHYGQWTLTTKLSMQNKLNVGDEKDCLSKEHTGSLRGLTICTQYLYGLLYVHNSCSQFAGNYLQNIWAALLSVINQCTIHHKDKCRDKIWKIFIWNEKHPFTNTKIVF